MIRLPAPQRDPLRALAMRLLTAVALVAFVVFLVYLDRGGYRDVTGNELNLLDCAYYAVVSLSTTGYGDITPVSSPARLVNVLVVTPARVLFLIILVGTTLELLTEQYRTRTRINRWRKTLKDHVVICGYGAKGRGAVSTLLENGFDRKRIVVVEPDPRAVQEATALGVAVVEGSATRSSVLLDAHIKGAKAIIVATGTDEASVLVTLTARQLTGGRVRIAAAAKETENVALLKQSGAHHVVVSSSTAGRLLGLSTSAPPLIDVVEDLLTVGRGMALAMRSARRDEVGLSPREVADVVIALVRRGKVVSLQEEGADAIASGDLLVYIRNEPVPA